MKILITGKNGQLGRALIKEIPKVFKSKEVKILGVTRNEFNLLEPKACESFLKEFKPNSAPKGFSKRINELRSDCKK